MGWLTGKHNDEPTPYDDIEYNIFHVVNRLRSWDRWRELNWHNYDRDYMTPDGVIYCSPSCAIIDNPGKQWSEDSLEEIDEQMYTEMVEATEPGNRPNATCPHCEWELHSF